MTTHSSVFPVAEIILLNATLQVFENDFPAFLPPPGPDPPVAAHPLLISTPVEGVCDVLAFHPRHDLTVARLSVTDIERIIGEWSSLYHKRGTQKGIQYVQIFEVESRSISPVTMLICLISE